MKKLSKVRIIHWLVVLSILLTTIPLPSVYATEEITKCSTTEGCILEEGHEGECNVIMPSEPSLCTLTDGCTLLENHDGDCSVINDTCEDGCILESGHDGDCFIQCALNEKCTLNNGHSEECNIPFIPCEIDENCELENGHEGDCQLPSSCVDGCILESNHEGECFVKCTLNENCTLNNGHTEDCNIPSNCEENCILEEGHSGECKVQCTINELCTLNNGHDGECVLSSVCKENCIYEKGHDGECFVKCTLNENCTLNNGHSEDCLLEHECIEGCILEENHVGKCFVQCSLDATCVLNNGHTGECSTCKENCRLEKGHENECIVQCSLNEKCILNDGHSETCFIPCEKNSDCILINEHEGECEVILLLNSNICTKMTDCVKVDGHIGVCLTESEICNLSNTCVLPLGHDDSCMTEGEYIIYCEENYSSTLDITSNLVNTFFGQNITVNIESHDIDYIFEDNAYVVNFDLETAILINDVSVGSTLLQVTDTNGNNVDIIRTDTGIKFTTSNNADVSFTLEFCSKESADSTKDTPDSVSLYYGVSNTVDNAVSNIKDTSSLDLSWISNRGMGYDIELRWLTDNEDEYYNIDLITLSTYVKYYTYSCTIATSGVDYENDQMDIRIPYYLFCDDSVHSEFSDYAYVKPTDISLEKESEVDQGFYYYIEDNDTDIESDDMLVVKNKGIIPAGTVYTFQVKYQVYGPDIVDLSKTEFNAKGVCKSVFDSTPVEKESNYISFKIDTGIDFRTALYGFDFECLYYKPDNVIGEWDFENYNYVRISYKTTYSGSSLAYYTMDYSDNINGDCACVVDAVYSYKDGSEYINIHSDLNNNKAIFAPYDLYTTRCSDRGASVVVYVQYPKSVLSFEPCITNTLTAYDDDSHTPPEDMNDIDTKDYVVGVYPWVSYELPSGDLVFRDIRLENDNFTPQIHFLSGVDSSTEIVTEYNFNGHYLEQVPDNQSIELYIDNTILSAGSNYKFATCDDISYTSTTKLSIEHFDLNRTNGKTLYPDLNFDIDIYAGQDNSWTKIDTVSISESSRSISSYDINLNINYPDNTDKVKLVINDMPSGFIGLKWFNDINLKFTDWVQDAMTGDSTLMYVPVMGSKHKSYYNGQAFWDDSSDIIAYANGANYLTDNMKSDISSKDTALGNYGDDTNYYILRDNCAILCDAVQSGINFSFSYYGNSVSNTTKQQFERGMLLSINNVKYISSNLWSSYSAEAKSMIAANMTWDSAKAYVLLPPYVHYDTSKTPTFYTVEGAKYKTVNFNSVVSNYNNTGRELVIFDLYHDGVVNEISSYENNLSNSFDFHFGTYVDWKDKKFCPTSLETAYFMLLANKPQVNSGYTIDTWKSETINGIPVFNDMVSNGIDDNDIAVYTKGGYTYDFVYRKYFGIDKRVRTSTTSYNKIVEVGLGQEYNYYIGLQNTDTGTLNNLIFYDILEEAVQDSEKSWKGTFVDIDITSLSNIGCSPKVYYSTVSNLTYPEQLTNGEEYIWLDNTSIWSTTCPVDKSTITAIAVDARLKNDGTAFNVPHGVSASFEVTMKAPNILPSSLDQDVLYAFNRPAYSCSFSAVSTQAQQWGSLAGSRVSVSIPTLDVDVKKQWNDFNNKFGKRIDSVEVQLQQNGVDYGNSVILSESNNWSYTFKDLIKFDSTGTRYKYTVREVNVPDGYLCSITGSQDSQFEIVNTLDTATINITGKTVWKDCNDADGLRPDSHTVHLMGNLVNTGNDFIVDDTNAIVNIWKWSTKVVPIVDINTNEIIDYSIELDNIPDGYTADITGDYATGFTVTFTHIPTVELKGNLAIYDHCNCEDKRPDTCIIEIYNGVQKVNEVPIVLQDNTSQYNWDNVILPKFDENNNEIDYTIKYIGKPSDYEGTYGGGLDYSSGFWGRWEYSPKLSIDITKTFIDNNNEWGTRRSLYSFLLYPNDNESSTDAKSFTIDTSDDTKNTYNTNIVVNKYDSTGNELIWKIKESTTDHISETALDGSVIVDGGYAFSYTGNVEDGFDIINEQYILPAFGKYWNDNGFEINRGNTPINFVLYKDYELETQEELMKLSYAPNEVPLSKCFKYVPRFDSNGNEINYIVVEEWNNECYEKNLSHKGLTYLNTAQYTWNYVNSIKMTTGYISKVYNDGNNAYNLRPSELPYLNMKNCTASGLVLNEVSNIQLLMNNIHIQFPTYVLNQSTFEYEDVIFEVEEIAESVGTWQYIDNYMVSSLQYNMYVPSYSIGIQNTYTITNTEQVVLWGRKIWSDSADREGFRPDTIELALYKDRGKTTQELLKTIELIADKHTATPNSWVRAFGVYPRYNLDGTEIDYSVVEVAPEGYSVKYSKEVSPDGRYVYYTVTNTHEVNVYDIPVKVVWDDNEDKLGLRPDSIEAQLKINGVDYSTPLQLEKLADKTWSESAWTDMSDYTNKEFNNYSVTSTDLSSLGYKIEITGNKDEGFVIKYILRVRETDVKVVWDDYDDKLGLRPDSIDVTLTEDGTIVESTKQLEKDVDGSWTVNSWKDIVVTDANENATYELSATDLDNLGYSKEICGTFEDGYVVKYILKITTDINVRVEWEDYDNKLGERPDENKVILYKDGNQYGEDVELKEKDDGTWTEYTWISIQISGDEKIEIKTETFEDKGYRTEIIGNPKDGYVIKHVLKLRTLSVEKKWSDSDNKYGKRPEYIEIELYVNGMASGDKVKLDSTNSWKYLYEDLKEYKDGKDQLYDIKEVDVPSGYSVSYDITDSSVVITNSYEPSQPKPTDGPDNEPTPTDEPSENPTPIATPNPTPSIQPSPTPEIKGLLQEIPKKPELVVGEDGLRVEGQGIEPMVAGAKRAYYYAVAGARKLPPTGDEQSKELMLWIIILIVSGLGITVSARKIRKQKGDNKNEEN